MNPRRARVWNVTLFAAALALAYAVKAFSSRASAGELGFLLAPTARGVEVVTGHEFLAEAGAGYVNLDLGIAIAPACSGANLLVIAFATLLFGFLGDCRSVRTKLTWFGSCVLLAFAATILVNTVRISLSLAERALAPASLLSAQALHRAVGVSVYLGGLLGLYALVDRAFRRPAARAWSFMVPLFFYVGVTLVVPLLRGVHRGSESATHATVVLVGVAIAALLFGASVAFRAVTGDRGRCYPSPRTGAREKRFVLDISGSGTETKA